MPATSAPAQHSGRNMSWKVWLVFVVIYIAIIQGVGLVLGHNLDNKAGTIPDVHSILRTHVIPIALSMVFTIVLATWLGWWPQIWKDDRPVQRWVRVIPIVLLGAAIIGCDYGNLFGETAGLGLLLLLTVAMVGFTEELMFRGIGLSAFRQDGFSEGRVALWTSLVFGAVHLSNAFTTGGQAIAQAAVVSLAGYFLYLTRRSSGGILLAMIVHGTWDFALITPSLGFEAHTYVLSGIPVLVLVGLGITVLVRRHRIEPEPS